MRNFWSDSQLYCHVRHAPSPGSEISVVTVKGVIQSVVNSI